ncbi:MAG: hypothetical protein BWY57_02731 [Betaproteobacteria bacterium ADurb.Bin341]|jgi:hypothetical protein|nr:MAG: hypothetical protein BWY57_02731 [Betaproteobacteria bacterium ADurb.Bin341]
MKMRLFLWAGITCLCVFLSFIVFVLIDRNRRYRAADDGDLSLVSLICNTKTYDKKVISTGGFLHAPVSDFQDAILYIHEDDCRYDIQKNAIFVRLPRGLLPSACQINHRYVWIEGLFSASDWHRNVNSGFLSEISKLSVLPCLFGNGPTNAIIFSIHSDGRVIENECLKIGPGN